ncbi:MAG TPA: lipid A biosynthesis lauroyl acyltransferase [Pseudolabrys sp.]|nr:lipid A biosynthesis lauroyl acyltransferase [Pseudolabrys sp.]
MPVGPQLAIRLRGAVKRAGNAVVGAIAVAAIKLMRRVDPDRLANFAGRAMRMIGPLLPENRIARANLTAAFPEKTAVEIETILRGTWDNLGRMGAEFAHLDRLWDYDPAHPERRGRFEIPQTGVERFKRLAEDGKPALIFAAHLANWEMPGICAATYKLDSAVLYRRPNIARLERWISQTREASMGQLISTSLDAPIKLAEALQRGAHVGMLVDQYYVRGVEVTFFGQRTMANPLLARLARHFDCPIVGARIIRLPDNRFTGEITEDIVPARDSEGRVDVAATMQIVMGVIEGWIREHPEQWLWQHRRWRPEDHGAPSRAFRSR